MTQQETIREMSQKKLLNGEQKRVLYKLFEQRINNSGNALSAKYADEKRELIEKLTQGKEIQKLLEKKIDYDKKAKETEKEIEKLGFSAGYNNGLSIREYDHKELKTLYAKQEKISDKIRDLKSKLLADIYGLPMTYQEMTEYIETEIAKIEKLA